jgi:hypothetical protein
LEAGVEHLGYFGGGVLAPYGFAVDDAARAAHTVDYGVGDAVAGGPDEVLVVLRVLPAGEGLGPGVDLEGLRQNSSIWELGFRISDLVNIQSNPKSEIRIPKSQFPLHHFSISDFGFRISDFRNHDLLISSITR